MDLTSKQLSFIDRKVSILLSFLRSRDRKIKSFSNDLYCHNSKTRSLIGIDYNYLGDKKKGFELILFFSKYKRLRTDNDKIEAVDNDTTVNKTIQLKKETTVKQVVQELITLFNP